MRKMKMPELNVMYDWDLNPELYNKVQLGPNDREYWNKYLEAIKASPLGPKFAESLDRWEREVAHPGFSYHCSNRTRAYFNIWCKLQMEHGDPEGWIASINESRIQLK